MRNPTIGEFLRARLRPCAAGLLLAAASGGAQAQMTPEELVAAGLRVYSVRYNLNASGDGMIWFQLANKSGSNWHVASIRCEVYNRGGTLIFEQTFSTSLVVDNRSPTRETEGFVVRNFPRDFKSGCFIEKATRR